MRLYLIADNNSQYFFNEKEIPKINEGEDLFDKICIIIAKINLPMALKLAKFMVRNSEEKFSYKLILSY